MDHLTTRRRLVFERSLAENGFARTHLNLQIGEPILGEMPQSVRPLATFIHLSDLHICDAKSPARVEFMDRYADPDFETRKLIDYVGTYRPQEFLTLQVVEAMVQSANAIKSGPLFDAAIDGVLITGDVIDNGQTNELDWYKTLMDGGPVSSASGDTELVEAAHGSHPNFTDPHYYKPDASEVDRAGEKWGMPQIVGLAQAAQDAFIATGLNHPWFAIHGNHDALLQGTVMPTDELQEFVIGDQKLSAVREDADIMEVFAPFGEVGPASYPDAALIKTVTVTPDDSRRFVSISDWVGVHQDCGHDHGLAPDASVAYWTRDFGSVRVIALDTVNPWGGWQGCLDRTQFVWLRELLAKSADKYVVITSHHPLEDLFNGYVPDGVAAPALQEEVTNLLAKHRNLIAWICGHVHDHKLGYVKSDLGNWGYWKIRTGSHMDWPQQSRVIEIGRTEDARIVIGTQVFDHSGAMLLTLDSARQTTDEQISDVLHLAGISRIIAANDWQRFAGSNSLEVLEGTPQDRNAWLWLADPFAS